MARVVVDVMLKPEILDPQGQAVARALPSLGVGAASAVTGIRIGKRIELDDRRRRRRSHARRRSTSLPTLCWPTR